MEVFGVRVDPAPIGMADYGCFDDAMDGFRDSNCDTELSGVLALEVPLPGKGTCLDLESGRHVQRYCDVALGEECSRVGGVFADKHVDLDDTLSRKEPNLEHEVERNRRIRRIGVDHKHLGRRLWMALPA
ncbi:MAG: hypothetical protein ACREMB_26130 [Candidatus Rokuibacteriota bacterium]